MAKQKVLNKNSSSDQAFRSGGLWFRFRIILEGAQERLTSGFFSFISMMLGIFTFSLVESIRYKGLDAAKPWKLLSLTSGLSVSASGIIFLTLLYYGKRQIPATLGFIIIILFVLILLMCSIAVPVIGWWMYNTVM